MSSSRGAKGSNADGATKPKARSVATLQADLNVALERGDWGAMEEISASLDLSGTRGVSSGPRFARGAGSENDESTLGAISLSSLKQSAKRPGISSIASQRAEIDKAVASGDWDEVERLTTQLLNTKPSPVVQGMMTDTLIDRSPSSMRNSPAKSPFRDTPSSSEWSQSPMDKEVRTEKLRKLIAAKDWKGVHVLSGIYEMESKGTLPPTFASMSGDSAERSDFALGWLRGGNNNSTPPGSVQGGERRHAPPASPSTSTSTNSSELREFERLVNAQDWKGLAYFAGAEEDLDNEDSDGELLPRNLFQNDSLAPPMQQEQQQSSSSSGANDLDHVNLRETDGPQQQVLKSDEDSDVESIHGTENLIPHWQELVDKNLPHFDEKSKGGLKK